MNKTVATASMIASLSLGIPPRRRGSPYLDLATAHGTAAALKAEAPVVSRNERMRRAGLTDAFGESADFERAWRKVHWGEAKRAARKVRMARRRRRGW